jgi:LmbE family N-acetylglucosaminyl deacetylase
MTTYVVVAAHPDDADFGVAGSAAALSRQGHAVHYVLCTSGDAGSDDPRPSPVELARIREREQTDAGHILGLAGVHFLHQPDGELTPNLTLRKLLVRELRRLKADVVWCQDPRLLLSDDGTYLNHPDHRAAGQAALDAAWPATGNPSAYRDLAVAGLPAHPVREIWLYFTAGDQANHWLDITDTLQLKIDALAAHTSQIGEWASSGGLAREMTKWATDEAQRHALPYACAEGFQRIVLRRDDAQPPEAAAVQEQTQSPSDPTSR